MTFLKKPFNLKKFFFTAWQFFLKETKLPFDPLPKQKMLLLLASY
jgi:hypothetical protein